jgi:serine/threonine protein kinase
MSTLASRPFFFKFHIFYEQYQPLQNKLLGKGAYGYVCAVKNTETGERLAVKKVKKAFEDLVDAKRVLREISA